VANIPFDYFTPDMLEQRFSAEKPHQKIYEICERSQTEITTMLDGYLDKYLDSFFLIPHIAPVGSLEPSLRQNFLPTLDGFILYSLISHLQPRLYVEIGSGFSTKVCKRATKDSLAKTRIITIDPSPRTEIHHISNNNVPLALQQIQNIPYICDNLEAGDVLFFDGSHRSLMNSDVTVFFTEILPSLKKGVIVHIHDIFLPYDYPKDWASRFYNEQYLFATYLLFANSYDIISPNQFITQSGLFETQMQKMRNHTNYIDNIGHLSNSFWFRVV